MGLGLLALLLVPSDVSVQSAPPPKMKLVCRESERRLGSHVRTARRCLSEDEWREEDERRDRVPVTLRVTEGQGDAAQPTHKPQ